MDSKQAVMHHGKWLIAIPAALAAGTIQAQTSVTLYGVLDTNIEYLTNMSPVAPSAANWLHDSTGP